MTKFEKLKAAADALTESQVDALVAFAHSMHGKPFYETAPPEAIASIERGIAQSEAGQTIALDELSDRLLRASKLAQ